MRVLRNCNWKCAETGYFVMKKIFVSIVWDQFIKERKLLSLFLSKNSLFDILSMQAFNELATNH